MRHGKQIVTALILLIVAVASVPAMAAENRSASAQLSISATVRSVIRMEVGGESTLRISAADVARGWVEVPSAIHSTISTNSGSDYLIRYSLDQSVATSATVGDLPVGPAGAFRMEKGGVEDVSNVRLVLADGVRPGTYEFPITTTIHPVTKAAAVGSRRSAPVIVAVDQRISEETTEMVAMARHDVAQGGGR